MSTGDASRREKIEREVRHAQATRWPEGDSWIRGYAEDCAWLMRCLDAVEDVARAGISWAPGDSKTTLEQRLEDALNGR